MQDCTDGTDEKNCTAVSCPDNKFNCPQVNTNKQTRTNKKIQRIAPQSLVCQNIVSCEVMHADDKSGSSECWILIPFPVGNSLELFGNFNFSAEFGAALKSPNTV